MECVSQRKNRKSRKSRWNGSSMDQRMDNYKHGSTIVYPGGKDEDTERCMVCLSVRVWVWVFKCKCKCV